MTFILVSQPNSVFTLGNNSRRQFSHSGVNIIENCMGLRCHVQRSGVWTFFYSSLPHGALLANSIRCLAWASQSGRPKTISGSSVSTRSDIARKSKTISPPAAYNPKFLDWFQCINNGLIVTLLRWLQSLQKGIYKRTVAKYRDTNIISLIISLQL